METFNSRKILIRKVNFNDILTHFMIIMVKDLISLMESLGLRLCECSPLSLLFNARIAIIHQKR